MKKHFLFILFFLFVIPMIMRAQTIRLFPSLAPGEEQEIREQGDTTGAQVGGKSVLRLTNVGHPEITIYPAEADKRNGTALIVCPGGGYNILAYDLEGTEVCQWLNRLGITAVLLKYRVPRREGRKKHEAPLQDVQRAISWVRAHAKDLEIKADRIGVMGFSAGAHLSVMASTCFAVRSYPVVDEADRVSCRPDFCLLVYPAYLDGKCFQLAPEIKVTKDIPPTLLIQAEDDKAYINSSLFYYYALKEAGVPAWMHLYSRGGHGYGLRDTGCTVNTWPKRAAEWFSELGLLSFPNP